VRSATSTDNSGFDQLGEPDVCAVIVVRRA
jgi:hypothetical protein